MDRPSKPAGKTPFKTTGVRPHAVGGGERRGAPANAGVLNVMQGGRRDKPQRRGDRRIVAAVDIGGGKAACMIGALAPLDDGRYEVDVIGVGQHGGIIAERSNDVEAALRSAVETAERMAGERASRAYVAVRGRSIKSRRVGVDLETAGGAVTAEDVRDCLTEARRAGVQAGFAPLHDLPIRYLVDGEQDLSDAADAPPVGHAGDILTAAVLSLRVRESAAANLEALIGRCGLELEALVAGPMAACEAVLVEDERDLGVIMLDMGARTTDYAVYVRGALVACGAVGLGGEHITRDIAQIFGSPLAQAERIKTLYGSAQAGAGDEHRLIDFPQLADPSEIGRHSRADLAAVIAPRLEEIIELAYTAAADGAGGRQSIRRCVLTGGASLATGACDMAERIMGVKARLGRPVALAGAPDAATAPHFAVCVGLLAHAAKCKSGAFSLRAQAAGDAIANRHGAGRWAIGGRRAPQFIGGVAKWLRTNF